MKRPVNLAIIQIFALAFGLFVAVSTWLGNLMNPLASGLGTVVLWCAVVIVVITAAVLVELRSTSIRTRWFVAAAVLTGLIGLVPAAKYISDRWADAAYDAAEKRALETRLLDKLAALRRDLDARTAERRPYTPQEALDFLSLVATSNLSYRGLGDHSEAALALLRRALREKLIDPNGMVKGPRPVDVEPEPLLLYYYKVNAWIRPGGRSRISAVDWKIIVMLAGHGADLTLPGAAALAADLRKTETPTDDPSYIQLK